MNTLVMGCGIAGLLSAHAVTLATGQTPVIISKEARKSRMYGAQYLHSEIPGIRAIQGKSFMVEYDLWGDTDGYRRKVYGEDYDGHVSPDDFLGTHPGWDIRAAYDELWELYEPFIQPHNFDRTSEDRIAAIIGRYDVVISTIPRPLLCKVGHRFSSQGVWAFGDSPEQECPVRPQKNVVICNGNTEPAWYRASNIDGWCTVEYPEYSKPPIPGIAMVTKPLMTTCDCWPTVHFEGRYGKWQKGELSHQAFWNTYERLTDVRG